MTIADVLRLFVDFRQQVAGYSAAMTRVEVHTRDIQTSTGQPLPLPYTYDPAQPTGQQGGLPSFRQAIADAGIPAAELWATLAANAIDGYNATRGLNRYGREDWILTPVTAPPRKSFGRGTFLAAMQETVGNRPSSTEPPPDVESDDDGIPF